MVKLRHPGIVDLFDVLDEPTGLYLVYEWVERQTLRKVLDEKKRLPLEEAVGILIPVCKTLEFAHARGVSHKNLKPGNIALSERGNPRRAGFFPGCRRRSMR